MDDDIVLNLNSGSFKFLIKVLECALETNKLSSDERYRAILWSDFMKYVEESGKMCVNDH